MTLSVKIVGGNSQYREMFINRGWMVTNSIEDCDLVQFTGGEDVGPHLYGQKPHPTTRSNEERDLVEVDIYKEALEMGVPMTGICRGGQFLNVMNGGTLYQDLDGHATTSGHMLFDVINQEHLLVSSTHHQAMVPHSSAKLLATAQEANYKRYMKGYQIHTDYLGDDIEALYYEKTRSLCFQPHPEFANNICQDYYFELIDVYLGLYVDTLVGGNYIENTTQ